MKKRRGGDSNPRYGYPYTAFPVLLLQPLGHLSGSPPRGRRGRVHAGGRGVIGGGLRRAAWPGWRAMHRSGMARGVGLEEKGSREAGESSVGDRRHGGGGELERMKRYAAPHPGPLPRGEREGGTTSGGVQACGGAARAPTPASGRAGRRMGAARDTSRGVPAGSGGVLRSEAEWHVVHPPPCWPPWTPWRVLVPRHFSRMAIGA